MNETTDGSANCVRFRGRRPTSKNSEPGVVRFPGPPKKRINALEPKTGIKCWAVESKKGSSMYIVATSSRGPAGSDSSGRMA